jgi:hypothetical protein
MTIGPKPPRTTKACEVKCHASTNGPKTHGLAGHNSRVASAALPAPPSQKDRRVGRSSELDGRHVINNTERMIAERPFGRTGTPSHRRWCAAPCR